MTKCPRQSSLVTAKYMQGGARKTFWFWQEIVHIPLEHSISDSALLTQTKVDTNKYCIEEQLILHHPSQYNAVMIQKGPREEAGSVQKPMHQVALEALGIRMELAEVPTRSDLGAWRLDLTDEKEMDVEQPLLAGEQTPTVMQEMWKQIGRELAVPLR